MAITPTVRTGGPLKTSGRRRALPIRFLALVATPYRQSTGIARVMLVVGTALTLLVALVALFAPLIAPYSFDQVSADGARFPKQAGPSGEHWFGTNVQTFDVFSRVVWGARTELKVVVLSLLLSIVIGVVLGLVAGFVGGWLDRLLVLIMDALFAFPYLLLAIVVAFLLSDTLGGGVTTAAAAITAVYIPQYFRVVRNSTVSAKEATYVEAARALGAPPRTIMSRYLFTNVVQSVPVIATLNAADAVGTLAALGFLGYGIQPTEAAEWGYDLNRAMDDATSGIWWTSIFPGLAIVLLVMGLTFMGEGLNETLNPTLRVRRLLPVVLPPRDPSRSSPDRHESPDAKAAEEGGR
ncbi:ABC transporter permease [Actinopolymorpha pittospori]|uniref:Peptide/nickel transport system permease protein n=1 Tax=Actinopolymorpha pittospori TaxID=648752 RepID=A0A927N1V8_9ACTN|nr:ABC transporter permease [Actinopolymorpha pittospori]MBE1610614.1 peptide/nickel transport system permease protein [Actinopolymorpha pittospori]